MGTIQLETKFGTGLCSAFGKSKTVKISALFDKSKLMGDINCDEYSCKQYDCFFCNNRIDNNHKKYLTKINL